MRYVFLSIAFIFLGVASVAAFAEGSSSSSQSSESDEDDDVLQFPKCELGQFWSVALRRCRLCSACGPQLYELSACSLMFDTSCEWCLAEFPVINDDYIAKCVSVADRTFYEEQKLNTRLGARIAQGGEQSAYRFWNFEEPSGTEAKQRASYAGLMLNTTNILLRAVFFMVVLLSLGLLLQYYLRHRSRQMRYLIKTMPALQFTDEQNQVIVKSARELEKIIGKEGYELLQDPQFV